MLTSKSEVTNSFILKFTLVVTCKRKDKYRNGQNVAIAAATNRLPPKTCRSAKLKPLLWRILYFGLFLVVEKGVVRHLEGQIKKPRRNIHLLRLTR